jgi:alcohol dehydrogenase
MVARKMRAFVLDHYGGPDAAELREVDAPTPRAGEIRVRVHAAGLNPVDFKTREGKLKIIHDYARPVVMGNELAGTVESVGDGVRAFAPGDRVFARVAKDTMGALAELACVRAEHAAKIPSALDFEAAAAVPLAGLTALQALRDELAVKEGSRVFISAGAGGVGTFAIQIAKRLGAFVATTASPRGADLVRRLGADVVVDYTKTRFEDELRDYDGAFDLLGGDDLRRTFQVVERGGRVVSVAGMPEPVTARKDLKRGGLLPILFWFASFSSRRVARAHGVTYRYLFMHPSGEDLSVLASWLERGEIEVIVDRVFDLADVKDAFAYLEAGRAKGKVVVRI